ncbi:hypothetical protein ALC60_12679, partial [Trachymyrmex zeteki]
TGERGCKWARRMREREREREREKERELKKRRKKKTWMVRRRKTESLAKLEREESSERKRGERDRERRACARGGGTWRRTDRGTECSVRSMVFASRGQPTSSSQFPPALDSRSRHHRCRRVAHSADEIPLTGTTECTTLGELFCGDGGGGGGNGGSIPAVNDASVLILSRCNIARRWRSHGRGLAFSARFVVGRGRHDRRECICGSTCVRIVLPPSLPCTGCYIFMQLTAVLTRYTSGKLKKTTRSRYTKKITERDNICHRSGNSYGSKGCVYNGETTQHAGHGRRSVGKV